MTKTMVRKEAGIRTSALAKRENQNVNAEALVIICNTLKCEVSEIPHVDAAITMGCNVQRPFLPCSHREDWGLEDPAGKSDEAFLDVIREIERKVLHLKDKLSGQNS